MNQIDLPYQEEDPAFVPAPPVYCPDGFVQPADNTPCPVCGVNYKEGEACQGLDSLLRKLSSSEKPS